jgi:hypothetical protein
MLDIKNPEKAWTSVDRYLGERLVLPDTALDGALATTDSRCYS